MSDAQHSAVPYTRLVNLEVQTRTAFHANESRKLSAGSNNNKGKTHFSENEKKVALNRGRLMRHKTMALKKSSMKDKSRIQFSYTILHSDSDDSCQSTCPAPEVDRSTKLPDSCNSRMEEGEVPQVSPSEPKKSFESKKPPLELKESIIKSKKPPIELKESKKQSEFNEFSKECKISFQKSIDCVALESDFPPRISASPSSSEKDGTAEGSQDFTVKAQNADPSLQDSDGSVLSLSRTLIPEEYTDSVKQDTKSFHVSSDYVKQLCTQPPHVETSVSTSFDENLINPIIAPKSQVSITDAVTSSWGLTEQDNRPKKISSRVRVMLKPEDIQFFDKYIKPLQASWLSASYTDWLAATAAKKHPLLTANDFYIDVSEVEKFETDTRRFISRHISNISEEDESMRIDTLKDLTLISKDASDSDLGSLSDSVKTNRKLDFNGAAHLESSAPGVSYKPCLHELKSPKNVTLIGKELSDSDQDSLSESVTTQMKVKLNETTFAEGSHLPVIKTNPNKTQFSQMRSPKDLALSSKELSDRPLKFKETTYAEASEQEDDIINHILFKTNFNKLRSRLSRDRTTLEENSIESEREIDRSCNRLDELSLSKDDWIVATPPLYGWEDTHDEECPGIERSSQDLWRSVMAHAKRSANTAVQCIGTVGVAFGWWSVVQQLHSYFRFIEDKDNVVPTNDDDGYGFLEIDNDNDDKD